MNDLIERHRNYAECVISVLLISIIIGFLTFRLEIL